MFDGHGCVYGVAVPNVEYGVVVVCKGTYIV